jgi:hypothetical protein
MAAENFVFNISKGRAVEFYNRVENNDPAAAAFYLIPLSVGGSQAQGQDFDTVQAVLADANFDEQTAGGWSRKTLTDTELADFPAPNDGSDRYDIAVPQVTWTGPTAGNNVAALLIGFATTSSPADSAITPVTHHIFAVTADGNDVVLNVGDFLRAS